MNKKMIYSLMVVFMMVFGAVSVVGGGILSHDATVTLTPDIASCGDIPNEFNVNVANYGGASSYGIYNVKIYKAQTNIIDITCGDAPTGWDITHDPTELKFGLYCEYETDPEGDAVIGNGDDPLDFTFEATLSQTDCVSTFRITTLDNEAIVTGSGEGEEENHFKDLKVDCEKPVIVKEVGFPKIPGTGFHYWITQSTLIDVAVTEDDECDLGLKSCDIIYTVDGGAEITQADEDFLPDVFNWDYEWDFDEDSEHYITIECVDVAGNIATLTETDKVDDTPPETKKDLGLPIKIDGYVEWIDTKNVITMTYEDPEAETTVPGYDCSIGVDKTWYMNILVPETLPGESIGISEFISWDYCWEPETYCNSEYLRIPTPYDMERYDGCIDEVQKECEGTKEFASWEECVELMTHRRCEIDPEWHLYQYTGPFKKDEESCHVLAYFSIDKIGNMEDIQYNCFFVDKTAPTLTKEIEEIPRLDVDYGLSTTGVADASVSSDEAYEGDDSIYLYADYITDYPPSNEGRLVIPLDMELGDLDSIEWMAYVVGGYIPHVDIFIDIDGDGVADESLAVEYDKVQAPNDQLVANMNYAIGEWVNTFDDKGTIDSTAGMWLNSGAPGPMGGAGFIWGTLADWKAGTVDASIDATSKVVGIEIEVDGWVVESESYVDLVKVNGIGMLSLHYVTPETDITFSCVDGGDHPSGDEKMCFKVSYDLDPDGYNTDEYCSENNGVMEDDWCCVDMSDSDMIFNFHENEDSVHDLEYYCEDAVEKRSPTYVQYYKVDTAAPVITPGLIGPRFGDCLPTGDDVCYIQDSYEGVPGTTITIDAVDEGTCAVDQITCEWSFLLDGGYESKVMDCNGPHCDIKFYEDTIHDLKVDCCDYLGNCDTYEATFHVDSKGPEVTKKILGPQKIVGDVEWINTETTIELTAVDEVQPECASGTKTIYYRYEIVADMNCWDQRTYCDALHTPDDSGWDEYSGVPFPIVDESCHMIEFYAVDELGNVGPVETNCVFADHTSPTIDKVHPIGSIEDDGEEAFITAANPLGDFTWLTQNMPITFTCIDGGDHPSGDENFCFKVSYDYVETTPGVYGWGYDTARYCDGELDSDGYCCMDMDIPVCEGTCLSSLDVPVYEFYFKEDSMHNLEYYCEDAVGKATDVETQYYKVDTEAPTFKKIIAGPSEGICPPMGPDDICYVDSETSLTLTYQDGGDICAVDQVTCEWMYRVDEHDGNGFGSWTTWSDAMPITFPEECEHELTIKCYDALGNGMDDQYWDTETFYADHTAPGIMKEYVGPQYPDPIGEDTPYPHYINSITEVVLTITDDGTHKSGVAETKYRYTRVADEYCMGDSLNIVIDNGVSYDCQNAVAEDSIYYTDGAWETLVDAYGGSFVIPEESCHLIEIVSKDNVDKEATKRQCVFVDNSSPDPLKTVAEPATEWYPVDVAASPLDPDATHFYPEIVDKCWTTTDPADCNGDPDCIECWKVTMDTEITLDCTDPVPHPVGHEITCFKVEMDAEDRTDQYCENLGGEMEDNGYCCGKEAPYNFKFTEESEHNLEYYCVDALGNGDDQNTDDEKFKVIGKIFKIRLNDKWNLISVPFVLLNDHPDEVFEDTESVKTVYSYDENGDWQVYRRGDPAHSDLDKIVPGEGYWVLADCEEPIDNPENLRSGCGSNGDKCDMLIVGGSLYHAGPTAPPSKNLDEGWNLIGPYGTENRKRYNGPDSHYFMDTKSAYCGLYSLRNLAGGALQPTKWSSLFTYWEPYNSDSIPFTQPWVEPGLCGDMDPGAGYWVGMEAQGTYKPESICDDSILEAICEFDEVWVD